MSAPVPQQSRVGGIRPAAVSMVSGSAVVTALTMANAPWKVVVLTVCATLVVSLVLGLAKIVIPEESEHKLNLLLALIRYFERRLELRKRSRRRSAQDVDRQEQRGRRGQATGGDRTPS
ncbi:MULTISPECIES: hypothetical protein [unclassified Streptomyces]|uniref:hypothetical protein n=1 Tax=unclassified Streptomyces TaxID=2593676 RepID=UPI00093E91D9|nr:hypothetical protein [Streptomyces sp. CB01883]